ncbi:tetratricopeptide repeat protein [uncultured Brachyspira sp.]|uniref:tetratricopeptide repeat protein n=1 Tax=uncultured Brachyspira sp. TaxID=221953 RepID=UPI0025EAC2D1|nr:tetratricopeptide repeat protein [uncultured Brachyspira sp.]
MDNIENEIKEIIKETNENIITTINTFIEKNNLDYAKKIALQLINKEPNYKDGYLVLADIFYEEEDYKSIIRILDKALEYLPKDKDILESKIEALISTYKYEEAKETIEEIISLGDVNASVYGQYGVLLSIEMKYKEAIEKFKMAISLDKEDVLSMINMSIVYTAIYEYDNAIEILEKAFSINNDSNIQKKIDNIKKQKENSIFNFSKFTVINAKPDKFNLIVPENFNASVENSVLKIENDEKTISILLSYDDSKYDEKEIAQILNNFKAENKNLYSIISPVSVVERKEHSDIFGSIIFNCKTKSNNLFNAMAIVVKEEESIVLTIISTLATSNNLIFLAKEIINSLYIK